MAPRRRFRDGGVALDRATTLNAGDDLGSLPSLECFRRSRTDRHQYCPYPAESCFLQHPGVSVRQNTHSTRLELGIQVRFGNADHHVLPVHARSATSSVLPPHPSPGLRVAQKIAELRASILSSFGGRSLGDSVTRAGRKVCYVSGTP